MTIKEFARAVLVELADPTGTQRRAARERVQLAAANDALTRHMRWIAAEYQRCIIAARYATGDHDYSKNNGRAEAYRQAAENLADLAGAAAPDWERIKKAVTGHADGQEVPNGA